MSQEILSETEVPIYWRKISMNPWGKEKKSLYYSNDTEKFLTKFKRTKFLAKKVDI